VAQTKRKRRTKHRGTAAGAIETRGRTGRPPSADEKKKAARTAAREKRENTPPTWSGSAKRGALAAGFMFIFLFITTSGKGSNRLGSAVAFAALALILYIPAGYYLELYLFRRRQARKAVKK
jgi:hypothetical protein